MNCVPSTRRVWWLGVCCVLAAGLVFSSGCPAPSDKQAPKKPAPEAPKPEQKDIKKPSEEPPTIKLPAPEKPGEKPSAQQPGEQKPEDKAKPEEKPVPTEPPKETPEKPEKPEEPALEPKPEEMPKEEEKPKTEQQPTHQEQPKSEEKPAPPEQPKPPAEKPQDSEKPKEEKPQPTPKPEEKPAGEEKPKSEQPGTGKWEPKPVELSVQTEQPTPAWLPKPVIHIPEAEAKDPSEMKPYTEIIPDTDVKFDMVPIPGGKFLMGSPSTEKNRNEDEGPQIEVEIEPFWMGKCEVTWAEYELWSMKLDRTRREAAHRQKGTQPSERELIADAIAVPTSPYQDMSNNMGKDGYPAICMTQLAAKMYCKWLSAKTGRYYRLPTEAEWEYACRAGTKTAYSFGDDPAKLDEYAWYLDNSDDKYHRVGRKKPNPWGLHDMHGNVAEWVLDQYVPDFYKQFVGRTVKNPLSPGVQEYGRVVRGGSWDDEAPMLRSAARRYSVKDWKKQDPQIPQSIWYLTDAWFVGFRVVRPLRVPTPEEAKKYELDDSQLAELREYMEAQAGKM